MTREEFQQPFLHLREVRARDPGAVRAAFEGRRRRDLLGADGRLMIIAADHPARGALGVRSDPMAMAARDDLLSRLATALARPGVDGIVATADIVEDLLLLGLLEDKLVIGSMNRGGLQGAAFELDDRFTGFDARTMAEHRLDGGKMLCRICPSDPGTVATLESCGRAVGVLAGHGLMAMVEPFWSVRQGDRVVNDLSTTAVVRSVAVAAGLGPTSAHTWLKLPVVEGMDEVMSATTLPTLLLGGDPSGHPDETYASWEEALRIPGVRGLVIGRALLYPPDGDVAAAVDRSARLVHTNGIHTEETPA